VPDEGVGQSAPSNTGTTKSSPQNHIVPSATSQKAPLVSASSPLLPEPARPLRKRQKWPKNPGLPVCLSKRTERRDHLQPIRSRSPHLFNFCQHSATPKFKVHHFERSSSSCFLTSCLRSASAFSFLVFPAYPLIKPLLSLLIGTLFRRSLLSPHLACCLLLRPAPDCHEQVVARELDHRGFAEPFQNPSICASAPDNTNAERKEPGELIIPLVPPPPTEDKPFAIFLSQDFFVRSHKRCHAA
jgi:hypothetical protein